MNNKTPPFFIGIGAQRAGTSWLYLCLNGHPEIHIPRKEMHFFDNKYEKGVDWYCEQFLDCSSGEKTGEITPDYMSNVQSLERISKLSKQIKIIVILREPIERAYSATQLYKSHGQFTDKSFSELLSQEPSFLKKSLYSSQIENVYRLFPKENVLICLFDDIDKNAANFYRRVCQFLEIDDSHVPKFLHTKRNVSSLSSMQSALNLPELQRKILATPLAPLVHMFKRSRLYLYLNSKLLKAVADSSAKKTYYAEVSAEIKNTVLQDITKLEKETGLNLSSWREKYGK